MFIYIHNLSYSNVFSCEDTINLLVIDIYYRQTTTKFDAHINLY